MNEFSGRVASTHDAGEADVGEREDKPLRTTSATSPLPPVSPHSGGGEPPRKVNGVGDEADTLAELGIPKSRSRGKFKPKVSGLLL